MVAQDGTKACQPCSTSVEVQVLRSEEENDQIASNKSSKDTEISPPVGKLVSKGLEEFIANLECAVVANVGSIVEEISGGARREEVAHVCTTVLTTRSAELVEFAGLASDGLVVELGDDHTSDEASKWVQLVQPNTPELGNLRLGDGDTAEQGKDDLRKEVSIKCGLDTVV